MALPLQVNSQVLRTIVRYNTLPIKLATGQLYDSQILNTLLATSNEPAHCSPALSSLTVEVAEDYDNTLMIHSPGTSAEVSYRDIGSCFSFLHLTDRVLLPCCLSAEVIAGVLPGTASSQDALLLPGNV